jgi:hypothetical protein
MISLSKASRHDLNKLDVRCRRGMAAKAAIRLLTAMSMSDILGLGCHSRSAAVGLGRENAFIASSCSVAWRDFCAWPSLVYLLEFSPVNACDRRSSFALRPVSCPCFLARQRFPFETGRVFSPLGFTNAFPV